MKNYILVMFFFILLFSCDNKSKVEKAVEEIPLSLKVYRFDKAFFETPPSALANLKAEYPFFFPEGTPDTIWINKMKNPQWRELYQEVEKKYSLPVILHDERLTTAGAIMGFAEDGVDGDIDAEAARLILEDYLNISDK